MPKIILLADDSITIQKVVELTFSDGDYQVVATNNGNKAIQKLGELRPDIILSDIIMPEKNGYELCEYVKSHPDYRSIPVILLTGTFEPFDPDRAEKAGCDAVITKPFESQSLIHKVEELIEQSATSRSGAAKSAAIEPTPSPTTSAAPPAPSPAGFSAPEDEKDTGAWPKSKGEAGGWGGSSSPSAFSEPSSFSSASPTQPVTPPPVAKSGFDDDVFRGSSASKPAEESIEFGDQTKTLPKFSFDDRPREEPPAERSSESEVDYSGATKAFPKMSFDDLKKAAEETPSSSSKESSWTSPSQAEPASDWASPSKESAPFGDEPSASSPQASAPLFGGDDQEDSWAASPAAKSDSRATESQAAASSSPATPPAASAGGELSKEQIDQIARRVVELMSEQLVKSIAWEVIPDLAEMVVRERIKQLESEA